MNETKRAKLIADRILNKVLDVPWVDPDRDEAVLARQFNRLLERCAALQDALMHENPLLFDPEFTDPPFDKLEP